jgi:hypothetical protein
MVRCAVRLGRGCPFQRRLQPDLPTTHRYTQRGFAFALPGHQRPGKHQIVMRVRWIAPVRFVDRMAGAGLLPARIGFPGTSEKFRTSDPYRLHE